MEPRFTFECQNMWRLGPGKQDQESYVLQAAEALAGGYKIINKPTERIVNSFGTDCFDNLSASKVPASSLNWANFTTYHFQNSESSSLERTHFPMFDINRKIETILGPIKRTSYGTTKVRMSGGKLHVGTSESSLFPNLIEFASEEQQLQQQMVAKTSNHEMGTSESPIDFSHDHLSSKLVRKNHLANTNVTDLTYSHSECMVSEMRNNNERFPGSIGSSWTRLMDWSKACPLDIPQSPLSGEDGREIGCSSHIRLMHGNKGIPGLIKPNEMENYCNVRTVRTENVSRSINTRKEDSLKYANAKKEGTYLCHEDQMVGESAVSADVKGTSFFERLMLPALPHNHGQQDGISLPLIGSVSMKDSDGLHINSNFKDKWNEHSVKVDTMCVDVPPTSNYPEVGTSSKSQKDVACCSLNLSEIAGTKLVHNKDMSALRSESMDVDHLSCNGKPSSSMKMKSRDSDATLKWIKRLRPNTSDSSPIPTKRLKLGDVSSGAEVQNLVTKLSSSNLPQSHQLVETNLLPKNVQSCSEDSVRELPWVRRWCRPSQEITPLPITCVPEKNSNVLPENLEAKRFPSLAAMALMGKSVNNFRPCEFHRRGSTTLWNTD